METKGVFIPREIIYMDDLKSMTEKAMLAIYQYYTEQGKYKCCTLTKPQIADELNISVNTVKEFKKHLKDLGYIRTEGKNKVFYVGVQQGATAPSKPDNEQGATASPLGATAPPNQVLQHPITGCYSTPLHKKENKEEKRNNKEGMTNFDLLLDKLPPDYHTPERIDFIKNTYLDRINEVDFNESGVLDNWVIGIKYMLDKKFPVEYYVAPKVEPKKEEHNWWDEE